jgi:lysophospholipase L1-like esterase
MSLVAAAVLVAGVGFGGILYLVRKVVIPGFRLPRNHPKEFLARHDPADPRPVVACVGDSITHGHVSVSYVEMLEAEFGTTHQFMNAGINSELVDNVLQRLDDVVAADPAHVAVFIGTNDADWTLSWRNPKRVAATRHLTRPPSVEGFRSDLRHLVGRLQAETRARITLLSLPPMGERPDEEPYQQAGLFSGIIREVAAETGVTYLPVWEEMHQALQAAPSQQRYRFRLKTVLMARAALRVYLGRGTFDQEGEHNGFLFHVDHLHLNTRGARLVADLVAGWLRSGE